MGQNGQNRVRARVRKEIPIFFCICGRSNGLEAQSIATLTLWQAHPTFLKKLFYFLPLSPNISSLSVPLAQRFLSSYLSHFQPLSVLAHETLIIVYRQPDCAPLLLSYILLRTYFFPSYFFKIIYLGRGSHISLRIYSY